MHGKPTGARSRRPRDEGEPKADFLSTPTTHRRGTAATAAFPLNQASCGPANNASKHPQLDLRWRRQQHITVPPGYFTTRLHFSPELYRTSIMTNIVRIEVLAYGPDIPRTTWAGMPPQQMTLTVVRIWDSDGAEGLGATETYCGYGFDMSTFDGISALVPRVLGKEALDREARWQDLQTYVMPSAPGAVAAIDIALWDLAAHRAHLPLYRLLGGARSEIDAYASTPELETPNAYIPYVHHLQEQGFRAIKFHAWNVPDRDLAMLRAVHHEFNGSGLTFMHDAENRYDRRSALLVAKELEAMGFRWFEAPFLDYDIAGYSELRRRVSIPIVPHGLWFSELRQFRYALALEPWDAVRFDVTVLGGYTPARKVCALAEAYDLPVEPQSWGYTLVQAANLHLGLATRQASYFELPVPYDAYEFGIDNPFRPDDLGLVHAPDGPGLGIQVDWRALEGAVLSRREFRF